MGHTADVKHLLDDLAGFQPTFILSVPRVFEKVYNSSAQKAEAAGKGKIFHTAADDRDRLQRGAGPRRRGPGPEGQARGCSTSSSTASCAPRSAARCAGRSPAGRRSGTRLGHFYRGIGVTVLEGYGLTETTAASTVNTPGMIKIGTVGRPLARRRRSASPRTARCCIKGGQVFTRLLQQPAGHRRGVRRRLVPHRRPRRARRRRLPAHHRAQEGDHRHRRPARTSRPPCSRTGCARTGWSASAWSSATHSPTSPAWSPWTRRRCRPGSQQHGQAGDVDRPRPPRTPT